MIPATQKPHVLYTRADVIISALSVEPRYHLGALGDASAESRQSLGGAAHLGALSVGPRWNLGGLGGASVMPRRLTYFANFPTLGLPSVESRCSRQSLGRASAV